MQRFPTAERFRHHGMNRSRLSTPARSFGPTLAAFVVTLAACYPRPVDPVGVPSIPSGFARLPYLQDVTDTSAWVLWMPDAQGPDSVLFREVGRDSPWSVARVEDHLGGTRKSLLAPLTPSTRIEYRVVSSGTAVGPVTFNTAPPPGEEGDEPVAVMLFGDSGWGGAAQLDLARQMAVLDFDLAIHVGDIAYDDGSEEDFTKRHFAVYSRVFDAVPFYPSVGNHDVRADEGFSYDAAFLWRPPHPGARYYAIRWGSVLLVSIDTSSKTEDVRGLRDGRGRQFEWLERTLDRASSDPDVQWIVTFMHHPVYSHAIGISGHEPDRKIRRTLGPLFERYGVDLVTAGHDHHYERTFPVIGGKRVEPGCGPVHLLSGGGGASRYARDVRPSPLLAFGQRVYQFVDLRIDSSRIQGRVIGRDGEVVEEFTVHPFASEAAASEARCEK